MEIYLDHLATTPLDGRVLDAMLPWLRPEATGSPHAARHRAGWRAAQAVETARREVAALIGANVGEIVFTSGATEANNLALLGGAPAGHRIVASAIEHPSVLNCLPVLAARGHATAVLPVDEDGIVDCDRLERILRRGPALVSIMSANNEVGTLQPLGRIAALCRDHGATLHVDAVQSLSTMAIDAGTGGIDLLSLSGHKLYGPMGIGALYVSDGLALSATSLGGGQQAGRRSGTVPVALAVGLGEACKLARQLREVDAARLRALRERLFTGLSAAVPDCHRNGSVDASLPGCLNVSIGGLDAVDMLLDIPDIALSTGAACAGGGPSHVLSAMGLADEQAHGSLRFGVGRGTTEQEVDVAVAAVAEAVRRWRRRHSLGSAA